MSPATRVVAAHRCAAGSSAPQDPLDQVEKSLTSAERLVNGRIRQRTEHRPLSAAAAVVGCHRSQGSSQAHLTVHVLTIPLFLAKCLSLETRYSGHPTLELVKFISMETAPDVTRMRLIGGDLALDFINTRSGPPLGAPVDDVLTGYAELVAWCVHTGALDETGAGRATRLARKDPAAAAEVFATALRLRDDLDAIFRALATARQPSGKALSRLRDDEADALAHARLERRDSFEWSWGDDRTLGRVLRPVTHAATQLLIGGELDRIKVCGGCRFLFTDESKNRSRRWCSMEDCGTAEKVRRYVAARRLRTSD